MARRVLLVAACTLVWGCGDETSSPGGGTVAECPPGELELADGSCQPAGLPPDLACAPGELELSDGTCQPAGVPLDGCGEGFVHDGNEGCDPILPDGPCPAGQIAVPGDETCREISPCGDGLWGDIPVESDTEHVDQSYIGGSSDGSPQQPWTTVSAAVSAAAPNAVVAIAAGSYQEDLLVEGKAVRLWGRCPSLVEMVGTGNGMAAVDIRGGADGTELHGLAIRGDAIGVALTGSSGVTLDRIWIVGNEGRGLNVQDDLGSPTVTLKDSLIEQNHGYGLFASGATATVIGSVVRATLDDGQGERGQGIHAQNSPGGQPTALSVTAAVIESNLRHGVRLVGSTGTIDRTVVRSSLPASDGNLGWGISARPDPAAPATSRAHLELTRSVVNDNQQQGVHVWASDATIAATVVRNTQLDAAGTAGFGVVAQCDQVSGAPAALTLGTSLIADNHVVGVLAWGSTATVEATTVRHTQQDDQGWFGRGMGAEVDYVTHTPASLSVTASVVEQSSSIGVYAIGSQLTMDTTVVRDTAVAAVDGTLGRGVHVQTYPATGIPSVAAIRACEIAANHEAGVSLYGAELHLEATVIRDTATNATGTNGDGVMAWWHAGPPIATLLGLRIEQSARAGIASLGGSISLGSSLLTCQPLELSGEAVDGNDFHFDDLGGNLCGCPTADHACQVVSSTLGAPAPVGGLE